jgi:hypothetical protein
MTDSLEVAEPNDAEIIFTAIRRGLRGVHTALPGKIVSYSKGVATIQLTVQIETSYDVFEEPPPLTDVPVAWPISSAFYLHFPLEEGDGVTVHFYESDPSQWFTKETVEAPPLRRRHGFYPVAVPGPAVLAKRLTASEAPGDHAIFGRRGGPVVAVDDSVVRLGSVSASDPVALATALDTWLAAAETHMGAHVHTAPTGATSPPTTPAPAAPTTAANKVVAE